MIKKLIAFLNNKYNPPETENSPETEISLKIVDYIMWRKNNLAVCRVDPYEVQYAAIRHELNK